MYKICITCQEEKLSTEFRKDSHRVDGLQSSCKVCARLYHRSAYVQRYSEKSSVRNNKRRNINQTLINEYKSTLACIACNEKEIVCLEFHHPDPSQKEFTIGSSTQRSWESIKREIDKCVCLCANCHKKVHAGILDL